MGNCDSRANFQLRTPGLFWSCLLVTTVLCLAGGDRAIASPKHLSTTSPEGLSDQVISENSLNSPDELLNYGQTLFAAGRFQEAAQVWQQAAEAYQQQGQPIAQAQALTDLALAYFNSGQWRLAETTIAQSRALVEGAPVESTPVEGAPVESKPLSVGRTVDPLLAQILNTQGNLEFAWGRPERALSLWEQAEAAYGRGGDSTGQLGSQLNQARALQSLGFYRRSRQQLERSLTALQTHPDQGTQAIGLRMLGTTLQALGEWEQAQVVLDQSLVLTEQLQASQPFWRDTTSATRVSLGQVLTALGDLQGAREQYEQAGAIAQTDFSRLEAQINLLRLLLSSATSSSAISSSAASSSAVSSETIAAASQTVSPSPDSDSLVSPAEIQHHLVQHHLVQHHLTEIQTLLTKLPPSRAGIYARVHLADVVSQADPSFTSLVSASVVANWLSEAIVQAQDLKDVRAEAFALGQLGHLYELLHQWQAAQQLTDQALQTIQELDAPDIATRWQWQRGRILRHQGDVTGAIAAYTEAVVLLQQLRQDTVALDPNFKFSFREQVEPLYLELVTLLLDTEPDARDLGQIRDLIEGLQIAELDNFFREACLDRQPRQIDEIDPQAAVIYPILLPDRLAVIVSLPDQTLFHYETKLDDRTIQQALNQFLRYMSPHFFEEDRLNRASQLYDWLIRPALPQLQAQHIERLVFVLGGSLRNLPVAALYDGQHYLIETYGVALAPGLQLLEPRSLRPEQLQAVTAGLSEAHDDLAALPEVETEVSQIAATIPAEILLNQNFTVGRLQEQLSRRAAPIVHLATHGQFSSRPEETYLVAWDQRMTVNTFNALLQQREQQFNSPIELLVLSACQTATGDERAGLGLAGLTVRSGVRSTLATLWQVNDESTAQLMVRFYQVLTEVPHITKAEALRQAQLELLHHPESAQPFYWAPFVLIGNWL